MKSPHIIAENAGMAFARYRSKSRPTLKGLLTQRRKKEPAGQFWALKNVSFTVGPGQMLGVIGANGAGKSTLLRLLGGIGRPTTGHLEVNGRIGALLDLGGGFLSDLSGRENAVLSGIVAGLLRREVLEKMDAIVKFAELEEFIDAPVRTYSSGMVMRLAFSVAIHTDPEVLLVDEFLSVGDLAFQAKCRDRITALRAGGCAIVMVSHGMDQVRQLCDSVLWLQDGEVRAFDSAEVVATVYETSMHEKMLRTSVDAPAKVIGPGLELKQKENRLGTHEVEITSVILHPGRSIQSGGPLEVEIGFESASLIPSPIFCVSIVREDGVICLDTHTELSHVTVPDITGKGTILFSIEKLELGAGSYFVNIGIFHNKWEHAYDYHFHVYTLIVDGASMHKGLMAPKCGWRIS